MIPNWLASRTKWFTPGMGVKRWLILLMMGMFVASLGIADFLHDFHLYIVRSWVTVLTVIIIGIIVMVISLYKLTHSLLAPYRVSQHGSVVDIVYAHRKRDKGAKVVAIGGGTGLPSVLR